MNGPHVEALYYRFINENPNDRFDEAVPLITTVQDFDIELNGALLTVKPKLHFSDIDSAKAAIDPILKSWESAAFLDIGRYRIRFVFKNAKVIDRKPSPGLNIVLDPVELVVTAETVTVIRGNTKYPAPSLTFRSSELTDELVDLIKRYHDGQIPLAAMTNWFETILRREYGNRDRVSKNLFVQKKVLATMGRLSESSDPVHGRKAKGQGPSQISPNEIRWLEAVAIRLVERIGEINAGSQTLSTISMSDFPQI
ncbi:MAG: hypothetical protein QXX08_08460 [Candidatus Bathyarchaeia archaeon]